MNFAQTNMISIQTCNICGNTAFGPGPAGRKAENGALPCCRTCGGLERQRILRRVFQALPLGYLDWRRGLQFSPDNGVDTRWFRSYEVSVYGGENSLDIQKIDRGDGSVDFVTLNHVLEFIQDDLAGFDELTRIISPQGIMQICFSMPFSRETCQDFPQPFGPHGAWHLYGRDLYRRFRCGEKKLAMLVLEESDPATGAREIIHFFLKEISDVARIKAWMSGWSETIKIVNESMP